MVRANAVVPRLDFGDWHVPFPNRGHYVFLSVRDLQRPLPQPPPDQESGAWLGRVESGACVILPVRLDVQREGVKTVIFAVLHQGERLRFAGHDVLFQELRVVTLKANARMLGQACNQCRVTLVRGARIVQCPLCRAAYCDDCWAFLANRRCYSRSCSYSPISLEQR